MRKPPFTLNLDTFKNLCHLKNDSILDTQYNEGFKYYQINKYN